jgi:hypothetical protein
VAESTLSISYTDLLRDVGAFLGYPRDPDDQSDDEREEIDRYIQSGIRQFYYPPAMEGLELGYKWSFLTPTATLATVATEGAVDLPDDCGRVLGDFIYAAGTNYPTVPLVSEGRLLELLQTNSDGSQPCYAAVRAKSEALTATAGTRLEVAFWPVPSAIYTLTYRYEAYSGKLTAALPYPLGGMRYAELITESCLAVAERRANDEKGLHWDEFVRLLKAGVAMDRRQGARFFGHMGGNDVGFIDDPYCFTRDNGTVTYNGVDL